MRAQVRRTVTALGCVVVVATTAGCALPVPGHGRPADVVRSASAQRPATLLETSHTGLRDLSGYEVTGTLDFGGVQAQVDLQVGYSGGHGTLTAAGTTEVLDLGGVDPAAEGDPSGLFVTAPASYWQRQGVDAADAATYAGQQVSIPNSSPLAAASVLLTVKSLADLLFDLGDPAKASVLATSPVDGQPAWLVDFGTSSDTQVTVQIAGQRFPLRMHTPHGSLTFSAFGHEPRSTTPAAIGLSLPG